MGGEGRRKEGGKEREKKKKKKKTGQKRGRGLREKRKWMACEERGKKGGGYSSKCLFAQ